MIKSINLSNIQGSKNITYNFDEINTRIAGRNTSGKSTVKNSIALFTGTLSKYEIKGLIAKNKPSNEYSKVSILLGDNTILMALIESENCVKYYHLDFNMNIINQWENDTTEVVKILGFKVIEEGDICLNIKESKVNLFVNTSPTINGTLVDFLTRNEKIELKIAKLEERLASIKSMEKEAIHITSIRREDYRSHRNIDLKKLNLYEQTLLDAQWSNFYYSSILNIYYSNKALNEKDKILDLLQLITLLQYLDISINNIESNKDIEVIRSLLSSLEKLDYLNLVENHKSSSNYNGVTKTLELYYDIIRYRELNSISNLAELFNLYQYLNAEENFESSVISSNNVNTTYKNIEDYLSLNILIESTDVNKGVEAIDNLSALIEKKINLDRLEVNIKESKKALQSKERNEKVLEVLSLNELISRQIINFIQYKTQVELQNILDKKVSDMNGICPTCGQKLNEENLR